MKKSNQTLEDQNKIRKFYNSVYYKNATAEPGSLKHYDRLAEKINVQYITYVRRKKYRLLSEQSTFSASYLLQHQSFHKISRYSRNQLPQRTGSFIHQVPPKIFSDIPLSFVQE